MKRISFSIPDEDYEAITTTAIAKGLDRPAGLARFATYQYMSRIGAKVPSAVQHEQQAEGKGGDRG